MDLFSISQLQQFSGIKAHTIRIWELRYNALSPNRSKGNTRYYNNSQLRRLLNIVSLMNSDYKIFELCSFSDDKLHKLIAGKLKSNGDKDDGEYFISQLMAAALLYEVSNFEKIFSACLLRMGMKNTYIKVIYPMLTKIGMMWTSNTLPPAREHFISNIIRQKLFSAIDSLPSAKSSNTRWLLFLPEDEFHEIGLLFSYYLIRSAGKTVIYLGSNVPFETLSKTLEEVHPSQLLFFLVHNNTESEVQKYLQLLGKQVNKTKMYLSGNYKLISKIKTGKKIQWLHSIEELEKAIAAS